MSALSLLFFFTKEHNVCNWVKNWLLGDTPISREPLIRISQNLAQKYFRKKVYSSEPSTGTLTGEIVIKMVLTCEYRYKLVAFFTIFLQLVSQQYCIASWSTLLGVLLRLWLVSQQNTVLQAEATCCVKETWDLFLQQILVLLLVLPLKLQLVSQQI